MSERPEIVQANLGAYQRVCGRDYYEFFIPSSIKVLLATLPEDQLDEMALNNSRLFRYRFGFEPCRAIRERVLAFRKQYELLDKEIFSLRQLQRANQIGLTPIGWTMAAAWFQIGAINLACVFWAMLVAFSTEPAWKKLLGELAVIGFWFAVMCFFDNLYLAGWRALKRIRAADAGQARQKAQE